MGNRPSKKEKTNNNEEQKNNKVEIENNNNPSTLENTFYPLGTTLSPHNFQNDENPKFSVSSIIYYYFYSEP